MTYLGTQPNDVKKNTGLYTPSEILQLTKDGSWSGSLELIEEQTISSNVSSVDFINLENNPYGVYLCHIQNLQATGTAEIRWRFSTDNGSSFINSTNYEYASFRILSNGSTAEFKGVSNLVRTDSYTSTGTSSHNSYFYLYNMLDNSKYSLLTQQSTSFLEVSGNYRTTYGGGVLNLAGKNNAFQIQAGTITGGSIRLFGMKEI